MDAKKAVNQIQELVETDELEQAVEAFRQHKTLLRLEDREAEVISFKARLNALSREQRFGIIDTEKRSVISKELSNWIPAWLLLIPIWRLRLPRSASSRKPKKTSKPQL